MAAHVGLVDLAMLPSVTSEEDEMIDAARGITLAMIGGTLYATGALISGVNKWGQRTRGWEGLRVKAVSLLVFAIMCIGGLFVTFSIGTGVSTPVLNSITYATNLTLNMLFQIGAGFSVYTKEMRCGTIVFALTALMLGFLAPTPSKVSFPQIYQPSAIIFWIAFFTVWVITGLSITKVKDLKPTSSVKILIWALFVACLGSFTDSWARFQQAVFSGTALTISFVLYLSAGAFLQGLTVTAFSQTSESLYVPAQLCVQLTMNVIASLMLWGEYQLLSNPVPYFTCFAIIILSVYILTPDIDIISALSMSREIRTKGLSKGVAKSAFGGAFVKLLASWQDNKADKEARRTAAEELLLVGLRDRVLEPDQVIALCSGIYARVNPEFTPTRYIIDWLLTVPFLRDYLTADPNLAVQLRHWQPEQSQSLDSAQPESMEVGLA